MGVYRRGGGSGTSYEPFSGIVLTDTFNLHTERTGFPKEWLPDNSKRAENQQKSPIEVIVGNPPWSAGQRSSTDENPNVEYPEMEKRIAETYVDRSSATLVTSLYDTYKMAIRWASDRIGDEGVIAFVTNGSWIDGNADTGVRACLAEEFNSIYVLNLRGNQRTQGERSRREGGKVFGQGSRAPVAITILVKNPKTSHENCRIRYRDIGDKLSREDKLAAVRDWGSISSIDDWETITPDVHNDWIGKRDEAFSSLYPLGSKEAKAGRSDETIFTLYSSGYKSGRDDYIYNFSHEECEQNAENMVNSYLAALEDWQNGGNGSNDINKIIGDHSSNVRWDNILKSNLQRQKTTEFFPERIWRIPYRPFVKQHSYVDYVMVHSKFLQDRFFPPIKPKGGQQVNINRAICVSGIGSTKPFSALIVDTMPDLELVSKGQCFPRYRYEHSNGEQKDLLALPDRIDNISDIALRNFRVQYGDSDITKDAIFDYVYGVLHSRSWCERFTNNLTKELPRVPFAPDFHAFAEAGRALADLHLNYESSEEYPLQMIVEHGEEVKPENCLMSRRPMQLVKDGSELIVSDQLRISGIPPAAHEYVVNGRTPLGWLIDRYRIVKHKQSNIVNDPNGWFEDPRDLIKTICQIVHVSVKTSDIVTSLPSPFPDDFESAE